MMLNPYCKDDNRELLDLGKSVTSRSLFGPKEISIIIFMLSLWAYSIFRVYRVYQRELSTVSYADVSGLDKLIQWALETVRSVRTAESTTFDTIGKGVVKINIISDEVDKYQETHEMQNDTTDV